MGDPLNERGNAAEVLELVAAAAGPYLDALPDLPVRDAAHAHLLDDLGGPLPEAGDGAAAAVAELLRGGTRAATHSSGPRFFHFVVGGATPAAQAADRLTSPLAARAEAVVLGWLKELFGLPERYGGVLTPSATFANLTGLACARWWWARQHGVDVTADGHKWLNVPCDSGFAFVRDRELLAPVTVFVVCFRFRPPGVPGGELDGLNRRLGEELVADGRVYAGTTVHRGVVALRPAIVNWRTTEADVDLLVAVVREIGARLLTDPAARHDPGGTAGPAGVGK
ncbi:hypothetical protein [Saccharothrix xinjiangensis]|uniref:Pyridoxal-dependent decarboxylase-like protein n=1 Tax=Saccharothrix xinjiangensis TaxID=204798 RepID=A0ABV9XU85_9PSEU